MNHADPQSTGRSKYRGPSQGVLAWQYDTVYAEAGVVMTEDSVACFQAIAVDRIAYLHFVGLDGQLRKRIATSASSVTPLVTSDGTVYLGSYDGRLRAYGPDGTLKWTFNTGASIPHPGMNIGLDGTVYFISAGFVLCALNSTGQVQWQLSDSRLLNGGHAVLSMSPDGKTLYAPGCWQTGPLLLAIDASNGSVRWTFGKSDVDALAPVVDSQGHIYMLGPADGVNSSVSSLHCLNPDGSVRWVFPHGNSFDIQSSADPTIDINGNISFAMDTLYSVDYDGNLRWKMKLYSWADSPLVCDAEGTLYLTVMGASRAAETIAVSVDGAVLWRYPYSLGYLSDASPALAADGTLLLLDWRGRNLYALK